MDDGVNSPLNTHLRTLAQTLSPPVVDNTQGTTHTADKAHLDAGLDRNLDLLEGDVKRRSSVAGSGKGGNASPKIRREKGVLKGLPLPLGRVHIRVVEHDPKSNRISVSRLRLDQCLLALKDLIVDAHKNHASHKRSETRWGPTTNAGPENKQHNMRLELT